MLAAACCCAGSSVVWLVVVVLLGPVPGHFESHATQVLQAPGQEQAEASCPVGFRSVSVGVFCFVLFCFVCLFVCWCWLFCWAAALLLCFFYLIFFHRVGSDNVI